MTRERLERNKKIREYFFSRRNAGAASNATIEELAKEYYLQFETVRNIIYDGKYDTRYEDSKKSNV